jgi:hypothetical protein
VAGREEYVGRRLIRLTYSKIPLLTPSKRGVLPSCTTNTLSTISETPQDGGWYRFQPRATPIPRSGAVVVIGSIHSPSPRTRRRRYCCTGPDSVAAAMKCPERSRSPGLGAKQPHPGSGSRKWASETPPFRGPPPPRPSAPATRSTCGDPCPVGPPSFSTHRGRRCGRHPRRIVRSRVSPGGHTTARSTGCRVWAC